MRKIALVHGFRTVTFFFLIAWGFMSHSVYAETSFELSSALSSSRVSIGDSYAKDMGVGLEVRPQFNFDFVPALLTGDIFFQGRLNSFAGGNSSNRMGAGWMLFPRGLFDRTQRSADSRSSTTIARIRPYVSGEAMLNMLSIQDGTMAFSASTVDYQVGTGFQFDLLRSVALDIRARYEHTLIGGSDLPVSFSSLAFGLGACLYF